MAGLSSHLNYVDLSFFYFALMQIPTTRPKSPKLGRRKSSSPVDPEVNNSQSSRPSRLSLDEKLSQNNSAKGPPPVHSKKPQRKSLPKLPSQKSSLSNATNNEKTASSSKATEVENATLSCQVNEEASPVQEVPRAALTSEAQPHKDEELVVGEQAQPTVVQECIASGC